MNTIQENLIKDIKELLEKHNKQTLSISDINVKLPEVLSNILAIIEPNCLILNSECVERKYPVVINGIENHYTETQVSKLRKKNSANMLLDMPRLTLTIQLSDFKSKLNYENLSYPSQKILSCGMTKPGEFINQDNCWSRDTLKRYIFVTRRLLGDSKKNRIIITGRDKTSPSGSYFFNPRMNYLVIKNPKSTSSLPSINESKLNCEI